MIRARRVRILATLGPASSSPETIAALHRAGADVFRINMSHTSHDMLRTLVRDIRGIEAGLNTAITILADLQGPKLRVGMFEGDRIHLENGAAFRLDSDETPGDGTRVQLPHPPILHALKAGDRLLLDDGKITLRVTEASDTEADTVVVQGGPLSNRKGVSCPDTLLPMGALTEKDHADLTAALDAGVDWLALSFIQRPEDMAEARKLARGKAGLMAKIEKPQAIDRLDDIIELSDAVMVARGDLGVEMPLDTVPGLQKRITRAARKAGKPVVVATQMLESMIEAPVPTRAEVSDVATAVFEGADAVMLSAESAAGQFPAEAVSTMDQVARTVEQDDHYRSILDAQRYEPEPTGADALSAAASQIGETLNVRAIVCYTAAGSTALRIARERPSADILVLTPNVDIARRLGVTWGINALVVPECVTVDEVIAEAGRVIIDYELGRTGDRILTIGGLPLQTPGVTNFIRLAFARPPEGR